MQLPHIPFEIILAALFFVLPAVGNLLKKRREGTEREKNAESTRSRTEASTAQTSQAPAPRPMTSASPAEDWLEQARRRVAEAQGRETAGRPSAPPSPPLVKPRQTAKPQQASPTRTVRERSRPSLEGRSLEDKRPANRNLNRGRETSSLEGASLEGRSAESSRARLTSLETSVTERGLPSEAPPIRVQRLKGTKRATITGQALRFDTDEITRGLIWHQVLSPPRATLRRTRLSRRRP